MSDYNYLPASDGTGDAALAHVSSPRVIGSTTIVVDSVAKFPANFLATSGTLLSTGKIDPATKADFKGHVSSGNIIIDGFEPGSTDAGHTVGQVIVVKPNTGWANRVAQFIKNATGFGTPEALYAASLNINGVDIAASLVQPGAYMPFAGSAAPTGYLFCQGQAVSRTSYAALFTAIGTTYGIGDGSTTFNLPDLRGFIPVGIKAGDTDFGTLGHTGGEKTHTLTTAELAAHAHGVNDPGHGHSIQVNIGFGAGGLGAGWGRVDLNSPATAWASSIGGAGTGISIQNAGSGAAHNNLQPFIVANYIIKT